MVMSCMRLLVLATLRILLLEVRAIKHHGTSPNQASSGAEIHVHEPELPLEWRGSYTIYT
ncbi:hypothetical protein FOA52_008845 [Chlamydomonas sp. UWO 241]|nr:hypothetical protein FOA52_008845 [Chlamydomonas sp. UWO 241]